MPRSTRPSRSIALCLGVCLAGAALGACASRPADPAQRAEFDRVNDPLEPMNRAIFGFNQVADKAIIRPVAIGYRDAVPDPVRTGLHNAFRNLGEPVVFANKLLQGEPLAALNTLMRFAANSVFGLGGVLDIVTPQGLPRQPRGDFGATLASWGVSEGPYLVLPLLGPSNPRDAIGLGADSAISPWGYVWPTEANIGVFVGEGIDKRARYVDSTDELERSSIDYYAALRSIVRQSRRAELGGDQMQPEDELYEDPGAETSAPPGAADQPAAPGLKP